MAEISAQLDQYFALQQQIHRYFGYREDWVTIPMRDCREYWWRLSGEGPGDTVVCHERESVVREQNGDHYESLIYTQRFLPKWVYRAEQFTLVCEDPRTDGNRYLSVFCNAKEVAP